MPSASQPARPPHPGRTPAQRRALAAIGCGDPHPRMHPKVRQVLLDAGLIVSAGEEVRRDRFGAYAVPCFAMPIPVHIQWCSAVAATDEEMKAFEAQASR